jgi:hypothetical protein
VVITAMTVMMSRIFVDVFFFMVILIMLPAN